MRTRSIFRIMFFGLIALILFSVVAAFAAGLVIEPSTVNLDSIPVRANDLKPSTCTMNLNNIIRGSGTFSGTAGNDLILGSSANDTIDGGDGNDCILGAGGDDTINGGDGDDHILGGNGNDTCTGGLGTNSFETCETVNDP
jgi:hypothetical protein